MIEKTKIITLHKYFNRAQFAHANLLQMFGKLGEPSLDKPVNLLTIEQVLSVYYGLLYVVIEGWIELDLSDNKVDELLSNNKNVNLLKRYRNKTFHYQKNWVPSAYKDFYDKKDTAKWLYDLYNNLDRALKEKIGININSEGV